MPATNSTYTPRDYWTAVAAHGHAQDGSGFAPVLHPDAPEWFNRQIDRLQFRAWNRALRTANLQQGSLVLDVGCGTGRWLRRYAARGIHAIGIDATPQMLATARRCDTRSPLAAGEAGNLPFGDAAFDFLSDVTVVQHIPASSHPQVLSEMARVLKPGGYLVLIEVIRGTDTHIFPHAPQDWIELASSRGLTPITWYGQEYLWLDRLFVAMARRMIGKVKDGPSTYDPRKPSVSVTKRLFWALRRITVAISVWTEPLAEVLLPGANATHAVFVFRK